MICGRIKMFLMLSNYRRHKQAATLADSVVVSLLTVLFLASAMVGLALVVEPERLRNADQLSVSHCVALDDGERALSLFRILPHRHAASPPQLGIHRLQNGRVD